MNTSTTSTPKEPLFTLMLIENGGGFSPKSLDEIYNFIQTEITFWSWLQNNQNHEHSIRNAINQLNHANNLVNQARQFVDTNPAQYQSYLNEIQNSLRSTFIDLKLPHSSSTLGKRIEAYRIEQNPEAASYFASAFCPPPQGQHIQPLTISAWHGIVEGLIEKFNIIQTSPKGRKNAAEAAFEQLRGKVEVLLSDKTIAYEDLHRNFASTSEDINVASIEQIESFDEAQKERNTSFAELVESHNKELASLRKTFREELALRAPAAYWDTKRQKHATYSWITGILSFVGIGASGCGLYWLIIDLLKNAAPSAAPENWRVALLALVGLFAIWAVRLIVRMFLSNLHLASDADERVVMVKTYLSLIEGGQLSSNEDRQLILKALFRPTTDGLVKDEGIPPSFLEFLSRSPKS